MKRPLYRRQQILQYGAGAQIDLRDRLHPSGQGITVSIDRQVIALQCDQGSIEQLSRRL